MRKFRNFKPYLIHNKNNTNNSISITEKEKESYILEIKGMAATKNLWITRNGNDFLLKFNPARGFIATATSLDFGEVLYYNLSKKLDFDCVEATFVKCKTSPSVVENGVLIKSYLDEQNVKAVNYENINQEFEIAPLSKELLSVKACLKNLDLYSKQHCLNYDERAIKIELYKRAILDFFLWQLDRHSNNIEFLIKYDNISLAPCFDNSKCLAFDYSEDEANSILKDMNKGVYVGLYSNTLFFENRPSPLYSQGTPAKKAMSILFSQMINACEQEPSIKDFLIKVLSLDMEKEIRELEHKSGRKLETYTKKCSLHMWAKKKKDFIDFLQIKNMENSMTQTEYDKV